MSKYLIGQDKQLEMLRWLMLAWDGQWLARATAMYSPEEAGKLHTRVRTAYGKLEMRVLLNILGKERAASLSDAGEMLQTFFGLISGEQNYEGKFWPVQAGTGGGAHLQIEITRMTSLATLKKAAENAHESPGLACELLWSSWLETLLPGAQLQVNMRSQAGRDVFLVDSLDELYTASSDTTSDNQQNWPEIPELNEDISPIAALLQIPLEQIAPAHNQLSMLDDPYNVDSFQPRSSSDFSNPTPTAGINKQPPVEGQTTKPGGLRGRFNRSNSPASGDSSLQLSHEQNLSPAIGVDFATGRSLFSGNPELEARERVQRTKALPAISRMFMSKEAKVLMAKGTDEPQVKVTSLATNVDLILQRKLSQLRLQKSTAFDETFRVIGGPQGDLQIVIGSQTYNSVGDVPPGLYRDLLEQAVAEWTASQQ